MKKLFLPLLFLCGCHHSAPESETLSLMQIQDRNGVIETISAPDRLATYETTDFLSSQPYKKVLRLYRKDGGNYSRIYSYHPNGTVCQYLEAESMRANGAYKEWYANGILKIEAKVIGGTADLSEGSQLDWVFDGTNRVFDEHGNLSAEISYEKGSLEGTSTYYYPSGNLYKQHFFSNNLREGISLEYHENEKLKSKTHYHKGEKEGESLAYSEQEILLSQEQYKAGLLLEGKYYNTNGEFLCEISNGGGLRAFYDDQGILTMIEFRSGRPDGLVRIFSPSGDLQKLFSIKNDRKKGEEIEFYLPQEAESVNDRPIPKLSISWNDQTIHGPVKTWYPNGAIRSQREYVRNKKSGPALAWYPNGDLLMIEEYEEDALLEGQYFKIHKAEPISTVSAGSGLVTLYDETGALIKKEPYHKGKPVEF